MKDFNQVYKCLFIKMLNILLVFFRDLKKVSIFFNAFQGKKYAIANKRFNVRLFVYKYPL